MTIPAHIKYPGMILAFLGMSVLGQVFLVHSAFKGNGIQVEESYYKRAVNWEEARMANRQFAKKMGTIVIEQVQVRPDGVLFKIEAKQAPTTMPTLKSMVAKRPEFAKTQHHLKPKKYEQHWQVFLPSNTRGLWDLEITWQLGDKTYRTTHRISQ